MSQFWLLLCITLATIICYSQAQTPGPVSDLEWRGQRMIDEAPINRVAYAVHKLNDTMLVIAYSGIFTSGPAIRFVALTMDRNETGISSRTLFTRNFTNDIANITSGLHMVYDQGDVALVYQNASRMCLQTIGLRPPPSGGNQPPPPPGRAPPVNIGGEATFPHISTLSYPTTQRPYFSVVYSRDVHTGTINGTCLHHMYAAFDRIFSTLLLFCPISPDSPMDPFAEIWYHPDDLNSFFVISRAGTGNNFEVQRCTGVTTGVTCVGILTGSNGIPVASPIDMVASRRIQNNQFWFAWRASDNHVVSIIIILFDQTSVSKVSNVYNTSLAADSFNLVDSLNPEGVTLVLNMASVVYYVDYAWDSNTTVTQNKMFTLETAALDLYNNPFSLAAESLDNSVFALVSTFSGRASLNYLAVPFCGNSLVSPGLEECDILTPGCNSSCQCTMGPNPSGGCLTNETPSGFIPSSVPAASGTVEPVSGPNNEDKTIQTVVPSVVIPVVVVSVSVAVLVVLLKRRKKSKKVKDDKVRLEPTNYQAMPGTNPTLPNDSKSSQAASGEHVSVPIGLAPLNTMSSDDRMKIPYSDLKVIREIGSGAYGKVFLGEWQMTQVALKVSGMTSSEEFIREAELLINLRPHPNVVQILGVSTDGLNVVMIMEYCDGSSLDHLIKGEVSMQTKIKYLSGIAKGIYHLHKNNIIHRDLAARNILLSRGEPKISDFGMSRKVQEAALHGQTRSTIGPLRWMAPESLKSAQYSSKSDVWSFGILVWEVLAGKEPHLDSDPLAIGIEIRDKGFAPIIPDDVNPELTQLMKDCWQIDPAMRPDFAEICKRINRIQS